MPEKKKKAVKKNTDKKKKKKTSDAPAPEKSEKKKAPSLSSEEKKQRLILSIISYAIVVCAILLVVLFIAKFAGSDAWFKVICNILFGVFSWSALLAPLLMIYCAWFLPKIVTKKAHIWNLILALWLGINVSVLIGLIKYDANAAMDPVSVYKAGVDYSGAGIVGTYIGWLLVKALSRAGAFVLTIALMLAQESAKSVEPRSAEGGRAADFAVLFGDGDDRDQFIPVPEKIVAEIEPDLCLFFIDVSVVFDVAVSFFGIDGAVRRDAGSGQSAADPGVLGEPGPRFFVGDLFADLYGAALSGNAGDEPVMPDGTGLIPAALRGVVSVVLPAVAGGQSE